MSKRIVCALLTLILLIGLIPANALTAFAKEEAMTGVVTNTEEVNVRKNPGVRSDLATRLKRGTKVTVYETTVKDNAVWGRIDEGWVYMFYVRLDEKKPAAKPEGGSGSDAAEKAIATGTVNSNVNLNVRAGAGVGEKLKSSLPTGTRISIYEKTSVNGVEWGRIDKDSWVCLTFVTLDNGSQGGSGSTVITGGKKAKVVNCDPGVNIRNGAGVNHALVGKAPLNSIITYDEVTSVNGVKWVHTEKGWICSQYLQFMEEPSAPEGAQKPDSGKTPEGAQSGVIANNPVVNVRTGPGVGNALATQLNSGTRVTVYETTVVDNATWGRIDQGWVYMFYVNLVPGSSAGNGSNGNTDAVSNATGVVVSNINLNVRTGPGLGFTASSSLKPGSKVTIYEQTMKDGMSWGRIDGGWVCMAYVSIQSSGNTGNGVMGTVARCHHSVNVRSAPGTGSALVGAIAVGSRVEILEQVNYNGKMWGHVAQGWISMDYVLLDSELPNPPAPEAGKPTDPTTPAKPEDQGVATDIVPFSIGCQVQISSGLKIRKQPTLKNDNIVGELKYGTTANPTALTYSEGKLWGRVDGGWIDMSFVKINSAAMVRVDGAALRKSPSAAGDKIRSYKRDEAITITNVALDGKNVWGRVGDGWIAMSDVEIGGKAQGPINQNPEVPFAGVATTNGSSNVREEAAEGSKSIATYKTGKEFAFTALKQGLKDEGIWIKVEADGQVGWMNLKDLDLAMKGHVTVKETYAYKEPGKDNIRSKLYNKDNEVVVTKLALLGSNVWGLVTGGWMDLSEVSFTAKPEYQNKNPEVVVPNGIKLNATAKLAVRTDASAKCTISTQVPMGDFQIIALKNDDQDATKLWAKVMVGGIPGWVDLSANVTISVPAIAKLPTVTAYAEASEASTEKKVYNKDDSMAINEFVLKDTVVWVKTSEGCYVKLKEIEVNGVPAEHHNPNSELLVYARGAVNADTNAYLDAADKAEKLPDLVTNGTAVVIQAVKVGEAGEAPLWAKISVNGVPAWVDISNISIDMPAIVRYEQMDVYESADGYVKAGKVWHNDQIKIKELGVSGGKVMGHAYNASDASIGWINMAGVEVDGKIEGWANNNPEIPFKVRVTTVNNMTGYMTATSLGLPYGDVPAGVYMIQALKVGDGHVFAKFTDSLGNVVWFNLSKAGFSMNAMAKAATKLYKDRSTDSKVLAEVPEAVDYTYNSLIIAGSTVWGKTTVGAETGWVDMSATYAMP